MPALNEVSVFFRFKQMLGPKENVAFCNGGAARCSPQYVALAQFVKIVLHVFQSSSGHEIIIPGTSLLCPRRRDCLHQQTKNVLFDKMLR